MMDKFGMIDQIIVQVNALLDARGVEKCRLGLDIVQRLAALREGLRKEDSAHDGDTDGGDDGSPSSASAERSTEAQRETREIRLELDKDS